MDAFIPRGKKSNVVNTGPQGVQPRRAQPKKVIFIRMKIN